MGGMVSRFQMLLLAALLVGCAGLQRTPIEEHDIAAAAPYGIAHVRYWGDALSEQEIAESSRRQIERVRRSHADALATGAPIAETGLALSGGGPDGAFGAGLLAGWTAKGDRPNFDVVTGVSTGAIIGLFAFLGPDYDAELREFYTKYHTDDLLVPAVFSALTGAASLANASGYKALVDETIDDDIVARIAEEAGKGRLLLIGTTNLDAARPVIWDITAIASSGHPKSKTLIRDIVRASSAVPAVFPPVVIPSVTADGRDVDEMHVDGGATQQVMLFSPEMPINVVDEVFGVEIDRTLYVIINNSLVKPYHPVAPGILSIAERAASSLISGSGGGDLYKIYAVAARDNIDFRAVWVPHEFDLEPAEAFDPAYMKALYDLGYRYGLEGNHWRNHPPNFALPE